MDAPGSSFDRNLFFQLRDGAIGIEDQIAKFGQASIEKSFKISNQLLLEALEPLNRIESMRSKVAGERAYDLWDRVMWRSTTYK